MPDSDIVLSTLNAKFIHSAFGLRYLLANLGDLQPRATLAEFEIHQAPLEVVEHLLALRPRLVGFGVYIWNVRPLTDVVALLRRIAPHVIVVLGGPEVSHETESQEIVQLAHHTITGEADLAFAELCRTLLANPVTTRPAPCPPKIIPAPLPDLARVALPYALYSSADLAHRILYVEASRGCPFTCEFCLSSLDIPVRQFPLAPFLAALEDLLRRGARHFKFVDRTFNLNLAVSRAILRFFRDHWTEGLFLHFEMIPDRLPEALRAELAGFPPGSVQLEIGIQSFDPEVCARISRRQEPERTTENFRFLRQHTGVHLHADLIVGLPGETLEAFARGFDRLVALDPQEIQVGMLKRLRGTPISRHDAEWDLRYSPHPPYEILSSRTLDFPTLQRLRRFARYWDRVANSGRFHETLPLIWHDNPSPFARFLAFSDWLHAELRTTHGIALDRLAAALGRWLSGPGSVPLHLIHERMTADWRRAGHRDLPPWLPGEPNPTAVPESNPAVRRTAANRRQTRHRTTDAVPPAVTDSPTPP